MSVCVYVNDFTCVCGVVNSGSQVTSVSFDVRVVGEKTRYDESGVPAKECDGQERRTETLFSVDIGS